MTLRVALVAQEGMRRATGTVAPPPPAAAEEEEEDEKEEEKGELPAALCAVTVIVASSPKGKAVATARETEAPEEGIV